MQSDEYADIEIMGRSTHSVTINDNTHLSRKLNEARLTVMGNITSDNEHVILINIPELVLIKAYVELEIEKRWWMNQDIALNIYILIRSDICVVKLRFNKL